VNTAPPAGAQPGWAYLALVDKFQASPDAQSLAFVATNDTHGVSPYRQAVFLAYGLGGRARIVSHSGLASVEGNTPYALWMTDLAASLHEPLAKHLAQGMPMMALSAQTVSPALAAQWDEWLPAHAVALALAGPDKRLQAVLLLARDEPWQEEFAPTDPEYFLLQEAGALGHAWWARSARRGWFARHALRPGTLAMGVLAISTILALLPVTEYALVPAEIVSTRSQVITAPRDGVIARMAVAPNTPVKSGQVLAELDDTSLHSRLEVARAALATAKLELHQATQRAIESQAAKAELHLAEGRLREREVEAASVAREMSALAVKAPADGVFVYSDPDDWLGRPVQTGEKLGALSDPAALGIQAWAPVDEAVNLKPGAPISLFLRTAPLSPIEGELAYAGYQAVESPAGVASHVLRGELKESSPHARIGQRGTARISGERVLLGYLLLRRPLATLREWCGC